MALTIDNVLKPLFDAGGKYAGKVKVIFRPQVQPWHASSTLTHESALAVSMVSHPSSRSHPHSCGRQIARASPESFWAYSLIVIKHDLCQRSPAAHLDAHRQLFKHQTDYYDIPSSHLTPLQIRDRLADLAAQVAPSSAVSKFKELLLDSTTPNGGTGVTEDLKYTGKVTYTVL